MSSVTEVWKPITGHEGAYEVSNCGRVRSMDRTIVKSDGRCMTIRSRFLRPGTDSRGYLNVVLTGRQNALVHNLVARAFIGEKPDGQEVNHRDGCKVNNVAGNLEYVSRSENQKHAFRLGLNTARTGEDSPCSKLKEDDVREIRRRCAAGEMKRSVAKDFGVTECTVGFIVRRTTWKHVA